MTLQLLQDVESQINDLVEQMTLAEKIGQMAQVEKNSLSPQDVAAYFIGSVLSGGGGNPNPNTPENWAAMVRSFQEAALQTRLKIPLIYGADGVHGHNNVHGAVIYPHNIGLGASRDAALVERIGELTAEELLATNVHWNFAPAVSVPQDVRWGRTYEGFSSETSLVTEMSSAYIRGLQSKGVLASVKHFMADGGAKWGTTRKPDGSSDNWQGVTDSYNIDQGDAQLDEETLRRVHLTPYIAAIEAGALNIMISHSSWNGLKMHAHRYLLTEVLKGECGFEGFLVSDWMSINQLDPDYYTCVVTTINAGLDMIMIPFDYKTFIDCLTRAVENGDVALSRVDDAVRRILRAKFALNLFEEPFGREDLLPQVGSNAHRKVAREAVRKSLVLVKNEGNLLPLSKSLSRVLVAGQGADDIGLMCGGWAIEWQGGQGPITLGTTILQAMRQLVTDKSAITYSATGDFAERAPLGVVVVGETPYAEGVGDKADISLSTTDKALIERMRAQCDKLVVISLSGRPTVITDQLALADAWVVAWWPGTEGDGITDVVFGDYAFVGRLAYDWPRSLTHIAQADLEANEGAILFPFGYGL